MEGVNERRRHTKTLDEAIGDLEKRLAEQVDLSTATTMQLACEVHGRLQKHFSRGPDFSLIRQSNTLMYEVGRMIEEYNMEGNSEAQGFSGGVKVTIEDI